MAKKTKAEEKGEATVTITSGVTSVTLPAEGLAKASAMLHDVERFPGLTNAIASGISELHRKHEKEILEYVEDAEDRKVKVAYAVTIDMTEATPVATINQRFSQSVKDARAVRVENPSDANQTKFDFVRPEDLDQKLLGLDGGEDGDDEGGQ